MCEVSLCEPFPLHFLRIATSKLFNVSQNLLASRKSICLQGKENIRNTADEVVYFHPLDSKLEDSHFDFCHASKPEVGDTS